MRDRMGGIVFPPDSTLVSDALDSLKLPGAIAALRPLSGRGALCGRAITVQIESAKKGKRVAGSHLGAEAISLANPGDIIVVANSGNEPAAAWGGLLSRAAALKGVSGVVVDGLARDVDECQLLGFPVFARGASPRTARGRFAAVGTQVPVEIAGVAVAPGDLVVADRSGVVFVAADRRRQIRDIAVQLFEREAEMIRQIESGADVQNVLDGKYEEMIANED